MKDSAKASLRFPVSRPGTSYFSTGFAWLFLILVIVLLSGAGGFIYYRSEASRVEKEKEENLAAIEKVKIEQLVRWRKERAGDIVRYAESPAVRHLIQAWLRRPEDAALRESILEWLRLETGLGFYFQALLTDQKYRILISTPDIPEVELESREVIQKALDNFAPVFSDLHNPAAGRIHQDIAMAVRDHSGRPLVILVLTTDAREFLFPLIETWAIPSRTAESLLVRRDGNEVLYLNDLRHQKDTAMTLRFPLSQTTLPAVQAVLGRKGFFVGRDYRGNEVLADLRPVPGTSWYLVTKEDTAEILGEVRSRAVVVTLAITILILCMAGLVRFVYRVQSLEDRRRAAEDLARLGQENKLILNSAAEGILGLDLEGKHTFVNPAAAKMLGYEVEELLGRPSHSLWHHTKSDGSVYPSEECAICDTYRNGTVHRSSIELFWRKDGTGFSVEYSSTPLYENDELLGCVVVFSDISERQRMEVELMVAKEMQFKTLMELLPSKVFLKDRNSVYISCNENYAKDLKIKPEEIVGKTDHNFFPTHLAENYRENEQKIMSVGKTEVREEEYHVIGDYLGGSKTSYIHSVKAPMRDKEGNVTGLFGLFWDITDQKKLEAEKNRVKVLASTAETKTKFASTVSHELRSPLAVIIGALDIALDGLTGQMNDELKEILIIAKRNSERLISLIANVLDFQKIESGKMHYDVQENDLAEVMTEVQVNMGVLSKKKGLDLRVELGKDLLKIKFDRDKLIQVLTNLVSNAIHHTQSGSIVLTARKEEGVVHIRVQDTGAGIAAEDIPKLFQPFEQVGGLKSKQKGGTGLGLAISKEIIFAFRGKIWAESELGKGSTFHVTLPI